MATQVHGTAWVCVLFRLLRLTGLLKILVRQTLLDDLAAVAAARPTRFLLVDHLKVLLRLDLLLVIALRLLLGLADLATE